MALYHTYRPQSFDTILGQPHIVAVFRNALAHDRIGHAYLFSGPRGVGKTSIARILAKAINCTASSEKQEAKSSTVPCNECQACKSITDGSALDVIEIDAASNRGIDEIRELRDRVRFAPSSLAKKVYIIDEVHMLTKEAFNALLKTLEEPPDHAVFVLATTELAKIPETIFSRCQHFQFRRAAPEALAKHLTAIISAEQRQIEPEALELVVLRAEGSYRDALSAMEQVLMADDQPMITAEQVRSLFGLPAETTALELLAALAVGDTEAILGTLESLSRDGISIESFAAELIRVVRRLLFVATLGGERMSGGSEAFRTAAPALLRSLTAADLVALLQALSRASTEARTSSLPTLPLELALLGFRLTDVPTQARAVQARPRPESPTNVPLAPRPPLSADKIPVKQEQQDSKEHNKSETNEEKIAIEGTAKAETSVSKTLPMSAVQSEIPSNDWLNLRRAIAAADSALGMLVAELTPPTLSDDCVSLTVPFKFHADQLQTKKSASILAKIFGEQLGRPVRVTCTVIPADRRVTRPTQAAGTVLEDPISAISEL